MIQTRMSSQQRGIERALAHLQQRLQAHAAVPDLAELAAVAHQSPFHFHRVYRAMTGETVGRTVTRLRLLHALQLLAGTGSITEIALAVGYETPQALARSFRTTLGASPSRLRADPAALAARSQALARPPRQAADAPPAPLQVAVRALAPFEVVVLRRRGAFDALDAGFGRLFAWAQRAGVAERLQTLAGIPLSDHRDVPARAHVFECAMGFAATVSPPAPFALRTLGGGDYVVLRQVGSYAQLEAALDRVLADWLPGSGYALRDVPLHYLYLDDPETVAEAALRADICVPVRRAPG
ncbi:AraC family transcriptional regulator [Xanthomonas sp. AM6]|uniref:AraC family transcriptional regulator n=1 Tax=Xanthomonas sp. AM6 TaxID=2982531 RepID=UPI0021D9B56A|nr:AraC family transcriptional regulator [Xanthomonas sp. AM6]UYB53379.1 AraC family transcriptional regulator [Xanthomonas sp. AM6]